jgi:hypothetical protein
MVVINHMVAIVVVIIVTTNSMDLLSSYRCRQYKQSNIYHTITKDLHRTKRLKKKTMNCKMKTLLDIFKASKTSIYRDESDLYIIKHIDKKFNHNFKYGLIPPSRRFKESEKR